MNHTYLLNGKTVYRPSALPKKAEGRSYTDPSGQLWEVWHLLRKDGVPRTSGGKPILRWIPVEHPTPVVPGE